MAATKRKPAAGQARQALAAREPSVAALCRGSSSSPTTSTSIGLALIALGVFLAGVAYLGWAGRRAGQRRSSRAPGFVFGRLGYAVPAALIAGGALVLLRELRRRSARCAPARSACRPRSRSRSPRARWARARRRPAGEFWHPAAFRGARRDRRAGRALGHLAPALDVGADILAVFLFLAGVILVTGATLAGVVRATGAGVAGTCRALADHRRSRPDQAARARQPRRLDAARQRASPRPASSRLRWGTPRRRARSRSRAAVPARARHLRAA